jgi:hypothetical protein
LLRDVDITQGLELDLSSLAADVETNAAWTNLAERGLGAVIVPSNIAWLTGLASGTSDGRSDVEAGKCLRDKSSSKGGCEN